MFDEHLPLSGARFAERPSRQRVSRVNEAARFQHHVPQEVLSYKRRPKTKENGIRAKTVYGDRHNARFQQREDRTKTCIKTGSRALPRSVGAESEFRKNSRKREARKALCMTRRKTRGWEFRGNTKEEERGWKLRRLASRRPLLLSLFGSGRTISSTHNQRTFIAPHAI